MVQGRSARHAVFLLGLAAFVGPSAAGCSQPGSAGSSENAPPASSAPMALAPKGGAAGAPASSADEEPEELVVLSKAPFKDGEAAFAKAKAAMLAKGYGEGLTEDNLYRAAIVGMLRFTTPSQGNWHELLDPAELAEIQGQLKGEIVGIGVQIKFDDGTGHALVLGALPGSPAEKAGLTRGDIIVKVDGRLYRGKTFRELVDAIRGKEGETVTLTLLRDGALVNVPVRRAVVRIEPASAMLLPGGVGYLRIESFSAKTVPAARAALASLEGKARALVLDLRHNPGGAFDDCLATAGIFLPDGTPVVRVVRKEGAPEVLTAKGEPVLGSLPLVILVDEETSSSAEVLAAALREGRKAQLVGQKTRGKGTVQVIEPLGNGFAIKFTRSTLETPHGEKLDGVGLRPDVDVTADPKVTEAALLVRDVEARLSQDVPLRTADALLRARL